MSMSLLLLAADATVTSCQRICGRRAGGTMSKCRRDMSSFTTYGRHMEWLNYHHLLYFWTVARAGWAAGGGGVGWRTRPGGAQGPALGAWWGRGGWWRRGGGWRSPRWGAWCTATPRRSSRWAARGRTAGRRGGRGAGGSPCG